MGLGRLLNKLRRGASHKDPQRFPDAGHFARSRGLAGYEKLFDEGAVVAAVEAAVARAGDGARLLELGGGEGRVLLELRRRFPTLELHGLNKEPWPAMTGTASLRAIARDSGLFSADELEALAVPVMHFDDAQKLDFPDAWFDVVISQVSIEHMRRKHRVLEEVWRVLKPGGVALLDVDARLPEMPPEAPGRTPRFVVRRAAEDRSLFDVVDDLATDGFALRLTEKGKKVRRVGLRMEKDVDRRLDLGLELSGEESVRLAKYRDPETHVRGRSPWWGFRSVFRPRSDEATAP